MLFFFLGGTKKEEYMYTSWIKLTKECWTPTEIYESDDNGPDSSTSTSPSTSTPSDSDSESESESDSSTRSTSIKTSDL